MEALADETTSTDELADEVEKAINNNETLFKPNEVVSSSKILQLVDEGVLIIDKMSQFVKKLRLLSYGTIKYPQSFAS